MADGDMTLGGLELRPTDGTMQFDIRNGYAEPAAPRGEDDVMPGAAGRAVRDRKKDHRVIELVGWIEGTGASLTAQQQSWRSTTDTLMAKCNRAADPVALVVADPYLGLSALLSRTINVRCIEPIPGPITAMRFQTWVLVFESVDSPPDWQNV